jgi:iron-sulfur cluster assembly protein
MTFITLTEKAQIKIKELCLAENNFSLRLRVIGGGCSGLAYGMDFSDFKDHDTLIDFHGFKIIIDPKSLIYLKDTSLDYADGLTGKGFIFSNPNAKNTCGCGESFSL